MLVQLNLKKLPEKKVAHKRLAQGNTPPLVGKVHALLEAPEDCSLLAITIPWGHISSCY